MALTQPIGKPYLRILTLLLLFTSIHSGAQEVRKSTNFQDDFKSFKNSIGLEFDTFVQHNDSVFIQFLSESWKELLGVPKKAPEIPKPFKQPSISAPLAPEAPLKIDSSKIHPSQVNEQIIPEKKDTTPPKVESYLSEAMSTFNFYGTEVAVPVPGPGIPTITSLSKEGIITYFTRAASFPLFTSLIKKVKTSATNCSLNDWGMASMLMSASKNIYETRNDQVLFTWYALIRVGINAKVGFNKERIYLLLPSQEKVYATSYNLNNVSYYLFDVELNTTGADLLTIYEADYPGNRNNFSFQITEIPQLGNHLISRVIGENNPLKLTINKDLIDFYRNYPPCDLNLFFAAPLSEPILQQLDLYFNPLLKDKNDDERVQFLLNFVQYSIKYQTDQEQFGREKYFFADETLYYPASDCEDRAVLLSKLIKHYTRLHTIGLLYPEHVSLAVNITNVGNWKYFTYKNERFYNCDPTYLGAQSGTIMPQLLSSIPEIID